MQRSYKPKWRKVGGGSLTLRNGRTVQPNETFCANDNEIPEAFRDVIERVDSKPSAEPEEPPQANLEVQHKGGGWYDLVNIETGKAINTTSLRHDEASRLVNLSLEEAGTQLAAQKLDYELEEGSGHG